jgi:hypothetical protein
VYSADVRNDTLTGGGLAAADLKPNSVGTSEVAANSLNGADVNESGLGIVPNADQLDGIDSTGFLSSGSVKQLLYEARVNPGISDTTNLASVGPYTIMGSCEGDPGGNIGDLFLLVNGPAGTADVMRHDVSEAVPRHFQPLRVASVHPREHGHFDHRRPDICRRQR